MLVVGVAWWPGGRTRHRALRPLPPITASTADAQAPAAASATVNDSGLTAVSPSSRPPPCSQTRLANSTCRGSCSSFTSSSDIG